MIVLCPSYESKVLLVPYSEVVQTLARMERDGWYVLGHKVLRHCIEYVFERPTGREEAVEVEIPDPWWDSEKEHAHE